MTNIVGLGKRMDRLKKTIGYTTQKQICVYENTSYITRGTCPSVGKGWASQEMMLE